MGKATRIGVSGGSVARPAIGRWLVRSGVGVAVYGAILFLSAGRVDWLAAWIFLGILTAVMIAPPLLLASRNPAVLLERERSMWATGVKTWDKRITTLAGALMPLSWVVAGLGVRFDWTPHDPIAVQIIGLGILVLGYGLFLWAMAVNPFFSQGARIQTERSHAVATDGPYRFVRHPGYLGTMLAHLGTPLLLGSLWALIPAVLLAALFARRTDLEDRMLREELPGYPEYARRVRFRLIPGIW
jgi:protein-S-isoprenylcysteine O-methyltransferase Ste14